MEGKSKSIEGKLAMYSAVAVGVLAGMQAKAQIYHTDIDPDKTITATDSFMLDLNNDGVMDFNLQAAQLSSTSTTYGMKIIANADYVMIHPLNNNEILAQTSYISYSNYTSGVAALNLNDEIKKSNGSNSYWTNSYGPLNAQGNMKIMLGSVTYGSYPIDLGFFKGVQDKYIGLRLEEIKNGDTLVHLGWVRVDVAADAKSFVVKDYAFEYHNEKMILAGATTSGMNENMLALNTNIFMRNRNLIIKQNDAKAEEITVSVTDMNGREISKTKVSSAFTSIDLSTEASGIYIVRILADNNSFQKKVILK